MSELPYDNARWGWYAGRYTYHEPHVTGGDGWYAMMQSAWLTTGYLVRDMSQRNGTTWRRAILVFRAPEFQEDGKYELVESIEGSWPETCVDPDAPIDPVTDAFRAVCDKYDPEHRVRTLAELVASGEVTMLEVEGER